MKRKWEGPPCRNEHPNLENLTLPKDLWIPILLNLNQLKHFQQAITVCKYWTATLRDDAFWENYVARTWHLDPTIKTSETVPAAQYAKLRLYLACHCHRSGSACGIAYDVAGCLFRVRKFGVSMRVRSRCTVLLSASLVGFVCVNWWYDEIDNGGTQRNGLCRVVCGEYLDALLLCGEEDLFVPENTVLAWDGGGWKETEQFGKMRRMLGFESWEKLVQEVVCLCVGGSGERSEWSFDDDGNYCWNGFNEFYSKRLASEELMNGEESKLKIRDVEAKIQYLEMITGLSLQQ